MEFNLLKAYLGLLIYQGVFFLVHLILISFVSFFHFLLNHDFQIIEVWLEYNLWPLLVMAKVIVFFIFYQFLKVKYFTVSSFFKDLGLSNSAPGKSAFISVFFLYTMIVIISRPIFNSNFNFSFLAFIFSTLFFGLDLIVGLYLRRLYLTSNKKSLVYYLVTVIGSWTILNLMTPNQDDINLLFIPLFITCFAIYEIKFKLIDSLFILISFFIPCLFLFGFGVDYDSSSIFTLSRSPKSYEAVVIWAVLFAYLFAFNRKKFVNQSGVDGH